MEGVSVNLHNYHDRVLLEVITDDGDGNVSANTVEFDIVDAERRAVEPCGDLPTEHEDAIWRQLRDAGYVEREGIPA